MPDEEKAAIIESLTSLNQNDKNFILGYMAGRTVDRSDDQDNDGKEGK